MNRKNIIITIMIIFVMFMTIGYAAFSTLLTINGTASIVSNWNVHFTDITTLEIIGSASEGDNSTTLTDSLVSIDVDLMKPGDSISYQVNISNAGSLDAYIKELNIVETGSSAIIVSITGLNKCDILSKGESKQMIVTISYDDNITSQPSDVSKKIEVGVVAEQYVSGTTCSLGSEGDDVVDKLNAGDDVLFNPVSIYQSCISEDTTTNCYKWYVLNDDGTNVDMILNRNLGTSTVLWNENGGRSAGPLTLLEYMDTQTATWSDQLKRSDSYTEYLPTTSLVEYTIDYTGHKARLATKPELDAIVTANGGTMPSWLYTNLNGGYWLASNESATTSNGVDVLFMGGSFTSYDCNVASAPTYLRPVITISKDLIS